MKERTTRDAQPIEYGFICSLCGLSDFGHARFLANGFTPYPCRQCRGHFGEHTRLGPMTITPERDVALQALWNQEQS